jgi:hypothetical protein
MLGAIVGDIVGSVYEFNNYRGLNFPLFTPRANNRVALSGRRWDLSHQLGPLPALPEEIDLSGKKEPG